MADLIYSAIASLDGFVADAAGDFGWAAPDEEVHAAVNDIERQIGTYLYGRRMYEVMAAWERMDGHRRLRDARLRGHLARGRQGRVLHDPASPLTARTRVARSFDAAEVRRMKETAARDLSVGGPGLAGQALAAGLVDECHLFLVPALVGGGTPAFPRGVRLDLELIGERRFAGGVVHLRHRVR